MNYSYLLFYIILAVILLSFSSCSKDNSMDDDIDSGSACDTKDVSYKDYVSRIIDTNCNGCHSSSTSLGGITTDNHKDLSTLANNGTLYGVIERLAGYTPMPLGSAKLDSCIITKLKSWVDDGALDN